MNSLSLLIYVASVAESLKIVSVILSTGGLFLLVVAAGVISGNGEWASAGKAWRSAARVVAAAWLVPVFIPSKSDIYAIAAAQYGEQLVNNEEVRGVASDATKALHKWIKQQLDEETKK